MEREGGRGGEGEKEEEERERETDCLFWGSGLRIAIFRQREGSVDLGFSSFCPRFKSEHPCAHIHQLCINQSILNDSF